MVRYPYLGILRAFGAALHRSSRRMWKSRGHRRVFQPWAIRDANWTPLGSLLEGQGCVTLQNHSAGAGSIAAPNVSTSLGVLACRDLTLPLAMGNAVDGTILWYG